MGRMCSYWIRVIGVFVLCVSWAHDGYGGTSGKAASLLEDADRCRKLLLASPADMKYRHHWLRCIKKYERIYSAYPGKDEAAWALYHAARLHGSLYRASGKASELDEAVEVYRKLAEEYGGHRLADDAYYAVGEIHLSYRKDPAGAREAFSKVLERYPSGDMAPLAGKRLSSFPEVVSAKPKVVKAEPAVPPKAGVCSFPASSKAARLLAEAEGCAKELARSDLKRKYRHNWEKCIRAFDRVSGTYPHTDEGVRALFRAARLCTGLYRYSGKDSDLDEALDRYRTIADECGGHRLGDDAQFAMGDIYLKYRNDPTQAYVEYLKVDIKFPSGDMRPKAREMLDTLAATLSPDEKKTEEARPGTPAPHVVTVKDIRHWSTPNYTRVVIDLDAPAAYEHHLLDAAPKRNIPRRLYLDVKDSRVSAEIDRVVPIKGELLQRARAGQHDEHTVRVVLDSESVGSYKVFHLHDPFRIVVDVRRTSAADDADDAKPRSVAQTKRTAGKGVRKVETPDRSVSLARQLGLNVKRIVIDPGHGGKDPGCMVGGGIREKDIVLSLAKKVAERIRREIGCEVVLTRTGDVFLPLERRTAIANMKKADLFISLHINAHRDGRVRGLETYFLNMATDEGAVMVAARENATSQKNLSDLQSILNDLMLNTKIKESNRLAHSVHKGIMERVGKAYSKVKSLGVKQAPFYVLIGAEMPAVLVETGFLTNNTERKRLQSTEYQQQVARGICGGIRSYIRSIDVAYKE